MNEIPTKHCCESMKSNPNMDNYYKWTDSHGWALYFNGNLHTDYRWCPFCDWCMESFPILDKLFLALQNQPTSRHRCRRMVICEWNGKKYDNISHQFLLEWDGYEWLHTDYGEIKAKHLQTCPYCSEKLPNFKEFVNKVCVE